MRFIENIVEVNQTWRKGIKIRLKERAKDSQLSNIK